MVNPEEVQDADKLEIELVLEVDGDITIEDIQIIDEKDEQVSSISR